MGVPDKLESIRGRRYSDKRWRTQAKKICRRLKEYDYIDVKNELLKRARVAKRTGKRPTVGCYMPTDRQIVRLLEKAEWSVESKEGDGHRLARYRFEKPLSTLNSGPERESEDGEG